MHLSMVAMALFYLYVAVWQSADMHNTRTLAQEHLHEEIN